ncbi:MAG: 1-acyl-sn-glycerol-3-phosphate acyltransferase [Pseudomonadales bacterium]
MSEFDSIRPYRDDEVPEVLKRIIDHPELPSAAASFVMPEALKDTFIGTWATRLLLTQKARGLTTVDECQQVIAGYFEQLIEATSFGVTVSGLDQLEKGRHYLFTSNHRDIVLDSGLLNYFIHQAGHKTCRMAVGDNLLSHELAADLMKLNKSFVVHRGARGTREGYRILTRTSRYIRHSLEEGVSIWIAQKEGRAKDGMDRTDPALLKMLALAYRDQDEPLQAMVAQSRIVPVSISYELDPCAKVKARELYIRATEGKYTKAENEDVQSIVMGMMGQKGRIHIHVSDPISGEYDSPKALAHKIDEGVISGMRVFPTHVQAAKLMGDIDLEPAACEVNEKSLAIFNDELCSMNEAMRPYYLMQYGNLLRNRAEIGVGVAAPG